MAKPGPYTEPLMVLEPDLLRYVVGSESLGDSLFHLVDVATSGIGWGITKLGRSPLVRVAGGAAGVAMLGLSFIEECINPTAHTAPPELDVGPAWTGHRTQPTNGKPK
jgi:hypothetical protein